MKRIILLATIALSFSLVTLDSCTRAPYQKSKKGRQQPKKGPMPCPMKDC